MIITYEDFKKQTGHDPVDLYSWLLCQGLHQFDGDFMARLLADYISDHHLFKQTLINHMVEQGYLVTDSIDNEEDHRMIKDYNK